MSEQIEIELSEETSQIVFENYEKVKDDFDSFDDYIKLLSKYLNLKMKETILKQESKRLSDEIKALESASYTWRWFAMCEEKFVDVTWELKEGEFEKICTLHEQTIEKKGLNPESYDIDDFMSDVFSLFLKKLDNDELELIINDLLWKSSTSSGAMTFPEDIHHFRCLQLL